LDDLVGFVGTVASGADLTKLEEVLSPDYASHAEVLNTMTHLRGAKDEAVIFAADHVKNTLPKLSSAVKEVLNMGADKAYTKVFQALGNNVRRSGNALSEVVDPNGLLLLPSAITQVIKLFRLQNRLQRAQHNYFAIDALRHPLEIRYLRERISPFYTVAVSTDSTSRRTRLVDLGYGKQAIDELDAKEYPSEVKDSRKTAIGYSAFVSQDIQSCLASSSIYIRNSGTPEEKDFRELGRQLCRYVALMQHPGLVTPTAVERCMHAAFAAKLNSGCISRQVGAVVTDSSYSIKAVGWNDAPRGQVPCLLRNTSHALNKKWDEIAYSKFELGDDTFRAALSKTPLGKLAQEHTNGRNITYCFKAIYNGIKKDKNQVHTRSLHAEENAFLQISRSGGQGLDGGCLFTTASPCELCAKKAYQLGIKQIYYIDPYPGISLDHVLSGGTSPPAVTLFSGAIGRAYHELYEPTMAYKDELDRLCSG
ncbi:hypothetical protein, partial [Candidatus Propionivibrio aalborgensis]